MTALAEVARRVALHTEAVHADLDEHLGDGTLDVGVVAANLQALLTQVHTLAAALAGAVR